MVKALLLGAGPNPVEGPWTEIRGKRWSCYLEGIEDPNPDFIRLEVVGPDGEVTAQPLSQILEGEVARAILTVGQDDVLISLFLEVES